uniref:Uncharacterized protein n=1 Tax=Arundo donax TaxID=35708 RepID=A0A0A9A8Q3_ARUDO
MDPRPRLTILPEIA